MFQRGWFHVDVERRDLVPELLAVATQYGPTRVGPLSAQAIGELAQIGRFAGLIVQVTATSSVWLERVFTCAPGLPVLALLDAQDRTLINRLQSRGASTALLPLQVANTVSFVQRALANNFLPCERVARTISQLAESRMLTAREVQLLSFCMGDEPRALVRRRLGITENTLKTQIRGLLRKCGERNLDSLAKNILKSALLTTGSQYAYRAADETQPMMEYSAAG